MKKFATLMLALVMLISCAAIGMAEDIVKSNMVYTLCKHMVYIFSLGSSTKR